nr:immunoglobulin heavy chain junction region [Mus musculus]MBK4197314.1 immunoglobulin heavy chain junction region [Mus musculus]MBK4197315.1 immunoglobulin heavy chain junction region [Mus musculus]
CAATGRYFDYW